MSFRERWWCCDINDRKFVERAIYYRNSNYDVWNKALLYTPNSQPLFTPKCSLSIFETIFMLWKDKKKKRKILVLFLSVVKSMSSNGCFLSEACFKDPWELQHLYNQENSQAPFMVYYPSSQNGRFLPSNAGIWNRCIGNLCEYAIFVVLHTLELKVFKSCPFQR